MCIRKKRTAKPTWFGVLLASRFTFFCLKSLVALKIIKLDSHFCMFVMIELIGRLVQVWFEADLSDELKSINSDWCRKKHQIETNI